MTSTKTKTAPPKGETLTIPPPNLRTALFTIVGTAPYVQNKFSHKARQTMRDAQEAGSQAKKKGGKKPPKDFQDCYEQSIHYSVEGWAGIPASAFRNAMISACRTIGFKMTLFKLSAFILADGYDADDGTALVRITKGEPHYCEHSVRLQGTTTDIRARAMWDAGWGAEVRVQYDADQFSLDDIANLMMRVGMMVGVGEGRPDSKTSGGMGWGLFDLLGKE